MSIDYGWNFDKCEPNIYDFGYKPVIYNMPCDLINGNLKQILVGATINNGWDWVKL